MTNYDTSHLPPPVQDALLRLTETMVDAWPSVAAEPASVPAVYPARQPRQTEAVLVPTSPPRARCAHGTPCCAACATIASSEAVLVEVQAPPVQALPRSAVELRVLETLQAFSPLPVTAMQIARMLGLARERVRTILVGLAMLDTIEHFSRGGYYRHKPPSEENKA